MGSILYAPGVVFWLAFGLCRTDSTKKDPSELALLVSFLPQMRKPTIHLLSLHLAEVPGGKRFGGDEQNIYCHHPRFFVQPK
jgi:hypothetical protein